MWNLGTQDVVFFWQLDDVACVFSQEESVKKPEEENKLVVKKTRKQLAKERLLKNGASA